MRYKILLAGDGGQGIQLMADIISKTVFQADLYITSVSNYGLEQRGGASLNYLQISDKPIGYPKFRKPDLLIVMSKQGRQRTEQNQLPGVETLNFEYYNGILEKENIKSQSLNVLFIGILAKILKEKKICNEKEIFVLLEKRLGKKTNWEENKRAFEIGYSK
ncbi:2-oxoacid:acceptor oxidoreductase family protein [Patescibacteria group bacterium]|nr:2-oxoacid:acceptor oxidoreductase family protein [Patescibacteria group bacterium]MBU1613016.1 2-oxoacid:acceptor oxidoreductase family protein [Patescibacteria group bacterium]